ncbi:MAG: hypothetical protein PHZ25_03665 [Candidatus Pacebacteria bacterium]|nr:hypothetical protein [Candidatus Paceibacterota bacterium]
MNPITNYQLQYNTTTTKLKYIINNYNNYNIYVPTTTKLQYILNTNPYINTYIPTTTTTLSYILNTNINYQLQYNTTTTKHLFNVSDNLIHRSINLSKAVTISTIPLLATSELLIDNSNLLADTKLMSKEEDKIQTIIVGDNPKPTGPLIIVVLEDNEYELGLPNYISRKELEGYQVKLEKVSNIGKRPEEMRQYFRKMKNEDPNFKFAVIPLDYLSGMVMTSARNGYRESISDYYYCKLDPNYTIYDLFNPDIYISRANRSMLEKEYTKLTESKMLITFPIMRYLHKIYDEGC